MNHRARITVVLGTLLLACSPKMSAQTADATLMAQIHRIKAIDNHSHPPRVVGPGETDDEFDALPCYPLEPTPVNLTLQPDNPMYLAAWHALWSYAYQDRSPDHVAALVAQKKRIRASQRRQLPGMGAGPTRN